VKELLELAEEKYPEEACAFVIDGRVVPVPNEAEDPTETFEVSAETWHAIEDEHGEAEAFFHSHPDAPAAPTAADMEGQIASGIPWLICSVTAGKAHDLMQFGADTPRKALVGRGFRHGVTDCYALIRDYYLETREIDLKEFPRDWDWWNKGQDLYGRGFEEAGFYDLGTEGMRHPQPGDVFLAAIRSPVINHGGIYVGNGLMLHHPARNKPVDPALLSRKEPIARWTKYITRWLRYRGEP
jgi:proteasome lid subunit RPN8/RPN11